MIKKILLLVQLIKDERVSPLLKLLPLFSLLYLIIPDFLPGPLDDAAVIALMVELFLTLIPEDIIQENRDSAQQSIQEKQEEDIIEGEFWEE